MRCVRFQHALVRSRAKQPDRPRTTYMSHKLTSAIVLVMLAGSSACTGETPVKESTAPAAAAPASPASPLRTMTARFAPADIKADLGALPDNERQALAKLVDAARIMASAVDFILEGLYAHNKISRNEEGGYEAVTKAKRDRRGMIYEDFTDVEGYN